VLLPWRAFCWSRWEGPGGTEHGGTKGIQEEEEAETSPTLAFQQEGLEVFTLKAFLQMHELQRARGGEGGKLKKGPRKNGGSRLLGRFLLCLHPGCTERRESKRGHGVFVQVTQRIIPVEAFNLGS